MKNVPSEKEPLFRVDEDKEDGKADMDISSGTEGSSNNNHNDTKSNMEEENEFYLPPLRNSSTEETRDPHLLNDDMSEVSSVGNKDHIPFSILVKKEMPMRDKSQKDLLALAWYINK